VEGQTVRVTLIALFCVSRLSELDQAAVQEDVVHAVRAALLNEGPGPASSADVLDAIADRLELCDDGGAWATPDPLVDVGQIEPGETLEGWLLCPLADGASPALLRYADPAGGSRSWQVDVAPRTH
jgi:hypothetical protein